MGTIVIPTRTQQQFGQIQIIGFDANNSAFVVMRNPSTISAVGVDPVWTQGVMFSNVLPHSQWVYTNRQTLLRYYQRVLAPGLFQRVHRKMFVKVRNVRYTINIQTGLPGPMNRNYTHYPPLVQTASVSVSKVLFDNR